MRTQHDRKFRPAIEGEYEEPWYRLPQMAAGWIIERVRSSCQARLDSMPEGYHRDRAAQGDATFMKAVRYIVTQVERGHGRRFQISTRRLAQVIGMSQSTASRCLRRLREMGVLHRHREHRVVFRKRRWYGKAAVHEVVTQEGDVAPAGDESRPLTCEEVLGGRWTHSIPSEARALGGESPTRLASAASERGGVEGDAVPLATLR